MRTLVSLLLSLVNNLQSLWTLIFCPCRRLFTENHSPFVGVDWESVCSSLDSLIYEDKEKGNWREKRVSTWLFFTSHSLSRTTLPISGQRTGVLSHLFRPFHILLLEIPVYILRLVFYLRTFVFLNIIKDYHRDLNFKDGLLERVSPPAIVINNVPFLHSRFN